MNTSRSFRFTASEIAKLPVPPAGRREVYRDTVTLGLELRVTPTGAKSFSVRQRVKSGTVERVTIGAFGSALGITVDQARVKAKQVLGIHSQGERFAKTAAAELALKKSFAEALRAYVKDDSARPMPLKERTRSDYLEMIRPASDGSQGPKHEAGRLWTLADRQLATLTGGELKELHQRLAKKGRTFAAYGMRVARAVLNYEGIRLSDDPFSKLTPKRDRVVLPAPNKRSRIIPSDSFAAWWGAAADTETGDAFQLMVLTGMRHAELKTLLRRHVDLEKKTLTLVDTKNRTDHVIFLSHQAHALAAARMSDQDPNDVYWTGVNDPRKSLARIKAATGVPFSAHDCRRTFATTAGRALPDYLVKVMLNHKQSGDVTADYINFENSTLEDAWQTVADLLRPRPADMPKEVQ